MERVKNSVLVNFSLANDSRWRMKSFPWKCKSRFFECIQTRLSILYSQKITFLTWCLLRSDPSVVNCLAAATHRGHILEIRSRIHRKFNLFRVSMNVWSSSNLISASQQKNSNMTLSNTFILTKDVLQCTGLHFLSNNYPPCSQQE